MFINLNIHYSVSNPDNFKYSKKNIMYVSRAVSSMILLYSNNKNILKRYFSARGCACTRLCFYVCIRMYIHNNNPFLKLLY